MEATMLFLFVCGIVGGVIFMLMCKANLQELAWPLAALATIIALAHAFYIDPQETIAAFGGLGVGATIMRFM